MRITSAPAIVLLAVLQLASASAFGMGKPKPNPSPTPSPTPSCCSFDVDVFDGDPAQNQRVAGAQVQVGSQQATSDGNGHTSFHVDKGTYLIQVDMAGFDHYEFQHNIQGSQAGVNAFQVPLVRQVQGPAPTVRITSAPPALSNNKTPSFSFTGTGDAPLTFECSMDQLAGGPVGPCTSPKTYSNLSEDGSRGFRVTAIDRYGRRSPTVLYRFQIDSSAPAVNLTSAPAGTTTSTSARFEFNSVDAKSGIAGFRCKLDSSSEAACTSPAVYSNLSGGRHSFTVKASDNAGNVSPPVTVNWTITLDPNGPLPAPTHPLAFGYYYSDGRYGDNTGEVFPVSNTYVAIPQGYDTSADWKPQFQASIQRAAAAGKDIFLLAGDPAQWDAMLDIVSPYWSRVKVVEVSHEEQIDVPTMDARATTMRQKLQSRGLATRPISAMQVLCQTYNPASCSGANGWTSSQLDYVGFEAYLPLPGETIPGLPFTGSYDISQVTANLGSIIDRARAAIPATKKIYVAMMSYDRNGAWTDLASLKAIQSATYLRLYDDPRVVGLFPFAWSRPGGIRSYPDLIKIQKQIGAAILGISVPAPSYDQSFITYDWTAPLTNGWFPRLTPDGRYVGAGTFGSVSVADTATRQIQPIETGNVGSPNWISPTTLTYTKLIDNNNAYRMEVKVGEWIPRQTADDPALVSGNQFTATPEGHWASWLASAPMRLAYDNRSMGVGGGVSLNGAWLASCSDNSHVALNVWNNGVLYRQIPSQTPLFNFDALDGYIAYGGYGPVHGLVPGGADQDLTVTPWRWENLGKILNVAGTYWVATSSWDQVDTAYVLLRPFGESKAIVVSIAAANFDVVVAGDSFVIAANDDKGRLRVVRLPVTAPRVTVQPR